MGAARGEDGSALTWATWVVVDSEDVYTFREAVKEEYKGSGHLAGIAASSVIVFDVKGGALPRESSPVNDPGRYEAHAIIVKVPFSAQFFMDVRGNLNLVQVQFDKSLALTPAGASDPYNGLISDQVFYAKCNWNPLRALPDGLINLSQGQAKSAFYYAYSRFGGIRVAKVYGKMYKQKFQREVDVNFVFGSHKNIVKFLKSFSIGNFTNKQRRIIVMPFFAWWRDSGDFGGPVRLGNPIVEITYQFCLGVAKSHGSDILDCTCLGATLAQLADIDITNYHSRQDIFRYLKDGHEPVDNLVGQLLMVVSRTRARIEFKQR
ncbi:hypothetical protein PsorP6_011857 [Peronosclerospora sorghi]|uniref:Uncharacterized protein n=1 Tax=Peronosclerospora sorghi TaxID=230839 RepID=A0ACC0WJN2_9STRA|nr:hypothetical protein PsorP6_011857 [Peronosclerospora sorghi]